MRNSRKSAANSKLNREWGAMKKWGKKRTSSIRRQADKKIIKEELDPQSPRGSRKAKQRKIWEVDCSIGLRFWYRRKFNSIKAAFNFARRSNSPYITNLKTGEKIKTQEGT